MKIFVMGVTGYIGGAVATTLQSLGHTVVGTARKPDDIERLASRGIEAQCATLDDVELLAKLARSADAVVSAAHADHEPSVSAVVKALEGSGKRFIHTSGSSIVATDARGELVADIYDEATLPQRDDDKRGRVVIDAMVRSARGLHTAVIYPTLIYGEGSGLHTESIQVPMMVAEAKKRGVVRYIGRGANVWSNVHIRDVADLYALALTRGEPGAVYFAENGEASFGEVASALARSLGLETESIGIEEAAEIWGDEMARLGLGSNSRVRGRAARALGWQPRGPSLIETILK